MSRVNAILAKDLRELRRDRRLVVMAVLVLALGLTGILTSFQQVTAYEADRAAALGLDRRTWEGQGKRNPHSAAHFAKWALRPLNGGALLDPGISSHAGSAIWMEAHSQNPARARPAEDRAQPLMVGEFSTAWVLQVLMPLMIAVIAASALARERERGTLRLLLASGASAGSTLRGKLASVGTVSAAIAGGLLLPGLASALAIGGARFHHLILWTLGHGIFLAIVVLVAVGVSARARSAGRALLVLVGLWLFAIILVPRAAVSAVEVAAPTPSPAAFWSGIEAAMQERPDPFGDGLEEFGQAMARQYGVARVADLPVDFGGLQLEESERQGNIVFDRFYGELFALYMHQRELMRWSNLLSPLPAIQNVSTALAGTDLMHQIAFQQQAETHRRAMVTQLNTDLIANGREAGWDYAADADFWRSVGDFGFVPPSNRNVLRAIWPDALILLGWLALAALFAASSAKQLRMEDV